MIKKDKIKLTKNNAEHIVPSYCYRLLDDMDNNTLYNLVYSLLVDKKMNMDIKKLEKEIREYAPDLLEYQP